MADDGTTVVAAWESPRAGESGHLATVRPGGRYSHEEGPEVANVGWNNGRMSAREAFAVDKQGRGASSMDEIHYYYDPRQGSYGDHEEDQ